MGGMERIAGLLIGGVVLLLIAGYLIVNLWPSVTTVSANVSAMTGTDTGTIIFKALWPVAILIVAIVIIIAIVFWALRKMNDNG